MLYNETLPLRAFGDLKTTAIGKVSNVDVTLNYNLAALDALRGTNAGPQSPLFKVAKRGWQGRKSLSTLEQRLLANLF